MKDKFLTEVACGFCGATVEVHAEGNRQQIRAQIWAQAGYDPRKAPQRWCCPRCRMRQGVNWSRMVERFA